MLGASAAGGAAPSSGGAGTAEALAALVQDKQAQANLAVVHALSEEAKKLLAQELERVKQPLPAMEKVVEAEPADNKLAEKADLDLKPPTKKARMENQNNKDKEMESHVPKPAGSVSKYLKPPENATEPQETVTKGEERQNFVMPKPKHRPVRWVQTDGGFLEIFTRMKPNGRQEMASQTEESYLAGSLPSSSKQAGVEASKPAPPPLPIPPPPPLPQPQLPPLPPPTSPHPDVMKKVVKQMLDLKETFEARSKDSLQ